MRILIIFLLFVLGCAGLSDALHTVTDIAHTLCMLAASERTEISRETQGDSAWCAEHAKEYVDEVMKAKSAADRKAGLGN